jgi:superfamily II DNA or RNA helicase
MVAYGLSYCIGGLWLYVVYGRSLIKQAQEDFERLASCVAGQGHPEPTIMVSGYRQSLLSDDAVGWTGLIIDECHHVAAQQRAEAVAPFTGPYRMGLSATPFERLDGNNALVEGLLGPLIYEVKAETLLENGYLTKGQYKQVII